MRELLRKFFFGTNGWTAGQYTLFRIALGLHLLIINIRGAQILAEFGMGVTVPLTMLGIGGSIIFVLGYFHRVSALVLAALWALYFGVIPYAPHRAEPLLVYILLAHIELRPEHVAPLSEFPQVSNSWKLPQPVYALIWMIAILFYTIIGASVLAGVTLDGVDYPIITALFLAAPLAILERFRRWVWLLMLAVAVYLAAALGGVVFALLVVQFFLFDPQWVPALRSSRPDTVFFDGGCGLCHRMVLFAIGEDRRGDSFQFAALGEETFRERVPEDARLRLPDSIVVLTPNNELTVKSAAVIRILKRLGGLWRVLAQILGVVPPFLRNWGYDLVARYRKLVFKKPEQVCPMVPADLQERFLP